ncbi:VWA domain-containing protein [Salicibibacter cibi]|uniref:VWA domain-containing protein n=1 Tax=Salicibibacter cibi TaxID=2743001 RepID=A0A7T6ZDQ2_9BACI|nr:VWA domain-containing protein [Salicibibacter cibi]QQK81385.1 VWA domain-containing protein [Salicibibacter cibi]
MKLRFVSTFLLIMLVACSDEEAPEEDDPTVEETSGEETSGEEVSSDEPELEFNDPERFSGDDAEEWMRAEPGTYYDEDQEAAVVETLVAAAEDGADESELLPMMLDLVAEDYRDYQDYFDGESFEYDSTDENPDELETDGEDGGQMNVQVLFDASGSMAEEMDGGTKMDLAKDAVEDFVSQVPEEANISLRVYGHEGSNQQEDKEESCAGTEEVYPLGSYDEETFTDALDQFEPTGYTPLGASIEAAQEDLAGEEGEDVENIVYVVSDGEETCGGDPAQAAEDLNESGIEAMVNIIGFDVPDDEQDALMEIADAGNGEYLPADTGEQLREAFEEERDELINEWREWESEGYSESREQYSDFSDEVSDVEGQARDLTGEEASYLRNLTEQLGSQVEEVDERSIRSSIRERARTLRSHIRSEGRDLRQEAREGGREDRRDIRQESREERQELRNEDIDD